MLTKCIVTSKDIVTSHTLIPRAGSNNNQAAPRERPMLDYALSGFRCHFGELTMVPTFRNASQTPRRYPRTPPLGNSWPPQHVAEINFFLFVQAHCVAPWQVSSPPSSPSKWSTTASQTWPRSHRCPTFSSTWYRGESRAHSESAKRSEWSLPR